MWKANDGRIDKGKLKNMPIYDLVSSRIYMERKHKNVLRSTVKKNSFPFCSHRLSVCLWSMLKIQIKYIYFSPIRFKSTKCFHAVSISLSEPKIGLTPPRKPFLGNPNEHSRHICHSMQFELSLCKYLMRLEIAFCDY